MSHLTTLDRKLIWHPYTQEKTADTPIPIVKGEGVYLYDENGNSYMDLISSWWTNLHGHSHHIIAEAIYKQAKQLEHVIFAGFSHEPAVKLCEKLHSILPPNLCRFFFSDNGSTAVEVAIKMAYQYWWNQNQKQRLKFISFQGGYHGDTFGAMSVGASVSFHHNYRDLLFSVHHIPFPSTWVEDHSVEEKEEKSLATLRQFLQNNHDQIAALIVEPLIQGASGMRFCRPSYLKAVIELVKSYDIIIIFDEVMTGFGRTGRNFALEYLLDQTDGSHTSNAPASADYTPDIICLSKGLTGGFLPLALTVCSEKIYQAFLADSFDKAFAHGHSYTANPLGCAAAIASLDLLLSPETKRQIDLINQSHQTFLKELVNIYPVVKSVRSLGTIAAFNLESEENDYLYPHAAELKKLFLQRGLLLRPLGNTIYFFPPYCITQEQLHISYTTVKEIIGQFYV